MRGVLDLRRLAEPIAQGLLQGDTPWRPTITPVARVQETVSLAVLLPLIRSGQPLLVVVDEHGGTEGLVTVADLTSEIVGDEDDLIMIRQNLQRLQDDTWLVAGDLEIFELNRQLDLALPEADGHHTLAGFMLERLQHIPSLARACAGRATSSRSAPWTALASSGWRSPVGPPTEATLTSLTYRSR